MICVSYLKINELYFIKLCYLKITIYIEIMSCTLNNKYTFFDTKPSFYFYLCATRIHTDCNIIPKKCICKANNHCTSVIALKGGGSCTIHISLSLSI